MIVRALAGMLLSSALACGGHLPIGNPIPDESRFVKEWQRYQGFGDFKALAMAGTPDGRFVIGYAIDKPASEKAREVALSQCDLRRRYRGIPEPCRLYAVGNERLESEAP